MNRHKTIIEEITRLEEQPETKETLLKLQEQCRIGIRLDTFDKYYRNLKEQVDLKLQKEKRD